MQSSLQLHFLCLLIIANEVMFSKGWIVICYKGEVTGELNESNFALLDSAACKNNRNQFTNYNK